MGKNAHGRVLITGGAGFIGSNMASYWLQKGYNVRIFDNLSRKGAAQNIKWIQQQDNDGKLEILIHDIRDFNAVRDAASGVDLIFHLAGQVAVTESIKDPRTDFEVNALGTLNVLESVRLLRSSPIIVYFSTNKVYGSLEHLDVVETDTRYLFTNIKTGISEKCPLDFHSPYGCSKGAAEQYVHDYARIFDLPTIVFRMSCIYGPRQFGTEDQGWLAHLLISTLLGHPITIYGDGKQVRDILFISDLLRAVELAVNQIDRTAGQVYNIGGGQENEISVWEEFKELLFVLTQKEVTPTFFNWRQGDQKIYSSDISKAHRDFGWHPTITAQNGVQLLHEWLKDNIDTIKLGK